MTKRDAPTRTQRAVSPQDIFTCSIVVSELLHGAEKYGNRHKRVTMVQTLLAPFQCLPFDDIEATAELEANLAKRNSNIPS